MTDYIMKYSDYICAIDTDGAKFTCHLADEMVDEKALGKMKYEYEFIEAAFLAPKVYGGITSDG
jgi:hypothetical protein